MTSFTRQKEILVKKFHLRLHFAVLGELVHLFAELHLLVHSLDVCGQAGKTHPQVGCHLKGLWEVRRHGLQLLAVTKVSGNSEAAVASHGKAGTAVVWENALWRRKAILKIVIKFNTYN